MVREADPGASPAQRCRRRFASAFGAPAGVAAAVGVVVGRDGALIQIRVVLGGGGLPGAHLPLSRVPRLDALAAAAALLVGVALRPVLHGGQGATTVSLGGILTLLWNARMVSIFTHSAVNGRSTAFDVIFMN